MLDLVPGADASQCPLGVTLNRGAVTSEARRAEQLHGQIQPCRFERPQQIVDRARRIPKSTRLLLNQECHRTSVEVDEVGHEIVRVLGLDAEGPDDVRGEVLEVERRGWRRSSVRASARVFPQAQLARPRHVAERCSGSTRRGFGQSSVRAPGLSSPPGPEGPEAEPDAGRTHRR